MKEMVSFCVIGGMLCVKNAYSPRMLSPEYDIHYYPTGIRESDFISRYGKIEDHEICNASEQFHHGVYEFRQKGYGFRNWFKIQLPNLAKTEAIKTEIVPILYPKVKKGINTRWNGNKGHWEKELKSGWCIA
jgi:hypothetical protein